MLAAKSRATVVILMGMKNLPQIIRTFKEYRNADEPIGIIMNGTTEIERSGFGTINDIEQVVKTKALSSPAIIIIGDVVNERLKTPKKAELREVISMMVAR